MSRPSPTQLNSEDGHAVRSPAQTGRPSSFSLEGARSVAASALARVLRGSRSADVICSTLYAKHSARHAL
eukprot:8393912-Pyramimonas_sp.AAC.1